MAVQDDVREWLRQKLKAAGRGSHTALAKHLRVQKDAITRMLNGENGKEPRTIKAHELAAMQEFFANLESSPIPLSDDQALRDQALKLYDALPADLQRVALSQLGALATLAEQERSEAGSDPAIPKEK